VPQHRAALENLIRHETGLEMRFAELSLRWGWHGPEAVFHGVELGEPGGEVLLRAPRLSVGLDTWRMVRSGQLEAGRITLQGADIDLSTDSHGLPAPRRAPSARPGVLSSGARILSRWRGGQIDIQGGTLRAALAPTSSPATFSIRYAQLRRMSAQWSADAQLLLPESLGASAHLVLQMRGDPATPARSSGTLSVNGQRLELAGWHTLVADAALARALPRQGTGNLELQVSFADGEITRASGRVHAESLSWSTPSAGAAALALQRLTGDWQLVRRGAEWRLSVSKLELASPSPFTAARTVPATLSLDVAVDGSYARGNARHAPVEALTALARLLSPQLPLGALALGGEAPALSFDWSRRRPAGARFVLAADLADLSVASPAGEVVLDGLRGHVSGADGSLVADLQSQAARLEVAQDEPYALDQLDVTAHLTASAAQGSWHLRTDALEIRRAGTTLMAHGSLGVDSPGAPQTIHARLSLREADVATVAQLLGARVLATLGAPAQLRAGRIESADVQWQGPLVAAPPWRAATSQFAGALQLRDGVLAADGDRPQASAIDARITWRGSRVRASIDHAQGEAFELHTASADWDAETEHDWHFGGRLSGSAQQALGWLRTHPLAAAWVPGVAEVDLRGDTLVDLDVTSPAQSIGPAAEPRVRVTALLDGGELRPVAGLPPIEALRGTLAFAAGRLQQSTLTGQWLGGPVSLAVGERRERGATALTIYGRGAVGARQAVLAAGGNADQVPLGGNAEWSAQLSFLPGVDSTPARWQLRADSSLVGLASQLPEPFAKAAGAALPLHLELQASGDTGQLHVSLAERLTAIAALERSGDTWRIERGAVRLATGTPALPVQPVMLLDGRVSRLDLVAGLALLRQAAADAALPALQAHLTAAQLLAGPRIFPEVSVTAETRRGAGVLQLRAAAISGSASWPAVIDTEHPAVVHLARYSLAQPADVALGAGLAAVLAPSAQLFVDDLQWQGRSLGEFGASLGAHGNVLEARDLYVSGPSGETHGGARCQRAACSATFSLDSDDAAGTLAAFGLRPDVSASHATLEGEFHWSSESAAPLATLGGHLHMQLDDGSTAPATAAAAGTPFALLSVPALLAGMSPVGAGAATALHFARITADYELRDGNAVTGGLHFDGDAEILLRGRVGLAAEDYDEEAWILRGEDRLPAAVRRLGPTPRVAAVWLSLRELFASSADHTRAALHLRGPWDDPTVTAGQ
jgi:uncharacterized protein YhdP